MASKFYAVKQGKETGIYRSWDECRKQTHGFPNAQYKSFKTEEEAIEYMNPSASELMTIDEDTLIAYVDGSFDNNKKMFSYGMVLFIDGKETFFAKAYEDSELVSMRNVAGEIKGAEAAMRYATDHGYKKLAIHYDYAGIEKWCVGEWKTNKEGTKAYKAFYDSVKDKLQVKFVKIKGHSNDKYNDKADELAKGALGIGLK
ncbi:MAG: viroplasmin family protein [Anaerostipes sp.]|jgi:viroplasmin and RNaseH domain-containing protein